MRAGVVASVGAGVESDARTRRGRRERSVVQNRLSRAQVELLQSSSFFAHSEEPSYSGLGIGSSETSHTEGGRLYSVATALTSFTRRLSNFGGARRGSISEPSIAASDAKLFATRSDIQDLHVSPSLKEDLEGAAEDGNPETAHRTTEAAKEEAALTAHYVFEKRILRLLENESVREERRIKALDQIYARCAAGKPLRLTERLDQLKRGVMPGDAEASVKSSVVAPEPDKESDPEAGGDGNDSEEPEKKETKETLVQTVRMSYWVLMTEPDSSTLAYIISFTILSLILISSVTFCIETLRSLQDNENAIDIFAKIEFVCIMAFTFEYVTKFIVAPNRTAYFFGPLNMIDLVAILPWYFELLTSSLQIKLQFIRVIRLVRVFRIMKLGGKFGKIQVVAKAMSDSMDMLGMLLFLLLIGIVIFSTLIYNLENGADWDVNTDGVIERGEGPGPFVSIPACFWWCMVTFMTVGYGDEYPVTPGGKFVASIAMIGSLLIVALPISVIGTNFTEEWMRYKERQKEEGSRKKLTPRFDQLVKATYEFNQTLDEILNRLRKQSADMSEQIVELKDRINSKRREKYKHQSQELETGMNRKWGSNTSYAGSAVSGKSDDGSPALPAARSIGSRSDSGDVYDFKHAQQARRNDKLAREIQEMQEMMDDLEILRENMMQTLRVSDFMREKVMLAQVNQIAYVNDRYEELCDETGLVESELETIESDAIDMYERWISELAHTGALLPAQTRKVIASLQTKSKSKKALPTAS